MNTLYVQLSADGTNAQAWLANTGGFSALGKTGLADLAQRYPGHATVLFLPSSLCLFTTVTASSRQLRQAGQSLAWLIEEQCGEDAEDLQVIAAPVSADDQAPLLGINREVLQNLLLSFRGLGLRVVAALPDIFLMTAPNVSAWQLLEDDGGHVFLRTAAFSGAALESSLLTLMLDSALLEQGHMPGLMAHIRSTELREKLQLWLQRHELTADIDDATPDISSHLATTTDWTKHPANFLQGSLAVSQRFALPPGLRVAAVFLAAAFVLQLLSEWAHWGYYRYQADKAATASVALYKQIHPDARLRTARPVDEVRKRFNAEREQGGGSEATTLATLTRVAESLQGSGLNTQRVDFNNGVLTLDVDARALTEIDSLRQHLDGQGLRTEIVSANAQGGLIRGRLRVEG